MAGHSKWANIKHQKAAQDAKRGKVFTRHAKLIAIAAQKGGGDPETNAVLRSAIDKAKMDNVPNDNIDRAIKKGTGALKDGAIIEEITYEAYGPEGIALLIECLTDNKNRTVSALRAILNKSGGSLAENGSVSWMFERKGILEVEAGKNREDIELKAIDLGAEDIMEENEHIIIQTSPESYEHILHSLTGAFGIRKSEITLVPKTTLEISDVEKSKQIVEFLHALEDVDDVSEIHTNADIRL